MKTESNCESFFEKSASIHGFVDRLFFELTFCKMSIPLPCQVFGLNVFLHPFGVLMDLKLNKPSSILEWISFRWQVWTDVATENWANYYLIVSDPWELKLII